jgi:uncharacterized protein YjiS (DUF1127 family)
MVSHVVVRPAVPRTRGLDPIISGTLRLLRAWRARARQRREALALSDRELRDIGLTREQLQRELSKPFWRD